MNLKIFDMGLHPNGMWFVSGPTYDQGDTIGNGTSYFETFEDAMDHIKYVQQSKMWESVMSRCEFQFEAIAEMNK